MPLVRALVSALLSAVAPPRCAACDLPLEGDESRFCGGCVVLIDAAPAALKPPAPSAALHVYGGPLADAIRRFKYGPRGDLAVPLGSMLAEAAPAYGGLVDRVVPVPLHPRRLAERGFDQSALLARPLARALGVRLDHRALERVRPTPPQAGLDARGRGVNVRGAFRASARRVTGARVLVIDDVRTTGATLAECALALRAAGALEVRTLCLAFAESDREPGAIVPST